MKHARDDYSRIQDPEHKIPEDEPVFLLRGQDVSAPATLMFWAEENLKNGGARLLTTMAYKQAERMLEWQQTEKKKAADL